MARRPPARRPRETTRELRLTSPGDRQTLEALALEIRRLARAHGLDVTEVRIARAGDARPRSR